MDQQQQVIVKDVHVDAFNRLHLEQLLELVNQHPGWQRLEGGGVYGAACYRQLGIDS